MEVAFLFLDESVDFDAAWLTGVVVSAERYAETRDTMLRIVRDTLIGAGHEHPRPMELHGSCLLKDVPGITDEHRIDVLERLVALVNRKRLEVVSVGHAKATSIRNTFRRVNMDPGDKLYNFNFYEIVELLELSADMLVVPVFDGVPRQPLPGASGRRPPIDGHAYETFMTGGLVTQWNRITAEAKPRPAVRFKANLQNLAEPTFSDSSHSPLLQLADVIGYILGVSDHVGQAESSAWKTRVAAVARGLDPDLIHRQPITMVHEHTLSDRRSP